MIRIVSVLLIGIFGVFNLYSQAPIISSKLDRDSMYIGESINYTFQINEQIKAPNSKLVLDLSKVENLAYEQDTNSLEKTADLAIINGFEIDKYIRDTKIEIPINDLPANQLPWKATINLGIYSIGAFHFPAPTLISGNGDTLFRNMGSFLFVKPPEGFGQDSTKLINPIKPIIELQNTWRDYLWILWTVLGLIIVTVVARYILKRKTKEETEQETIVIPEVKEAAHIIALRKLSILTKTEIWKEGNIKEYQSELTHIVREYLEGRYEINALEMTTSDIAKAIDQEPSMKGQVQNLKDILTVADLVKFAKAQPSDDIHKQFLETAIQFVNQTKQEGNVG